MKINSVVTYLINELKAIHNPFMAEAYLQRRGFNVIGRGCESIAFSRSGFEYVIKVMFDSHYKTNGRHVRDIPSDKHFTDTLLIDSGHFPIVIQKKVVCCSRMRYNTPAFRRLKKFIKFIENKWPNINDLSKNNIGMDRGQFKIFDWSDENYAGSTY
jgi:hypothetical protein